MYDGARSGLEEKEEEARIIYTNKKFAFAFAFDGIMIAKTDERIAVHKISRKLNFLAEQTHSSPATDSDAVYVIGESTPVPEREGRFLSCGDFDFEHHHDSKRMRRDEW